MSTHRPQHGADGSARHSADPSAPRREHLRVVGSGSDPRPPVDPKRDETWRFVQQHLQLASRLGVGPLTVTERARAMLATSCSGWRRDRQCVGHDATPSAAPHEACLLAQYHHDLLLLEHGLLGPVPRPLTSDVRPLFETSPPTQRKRIVP